MRTKHPICRDALVGLDDGLTDQEREGTRLAPAGWTGIDIAQSLGVRKETVSRRRTLPADRATVESHLADIRSATADRMAEFVERALDVIEEQMDYGYDHRIKLRAQIALFQLSGLPTLPGSISIDLCLAPAVRWLPTRPVGRLPPVGDRRPNVGLGTRCGRRPTDGQRQVPTHSGHLCVLVESV